MQYGKRPLEVIHDLGLRLNRAGPRFRLLIGSGRPAEDVRGHTVVVGSKVFYLLGERTDTCELACCWPERILTFRHGIGCTNNFILGDGYPRVECLAESSNRHRRVVLRPCRATADEQK